MPLFNWMDGFLLALRLRSVILILAAWLNAYWPWIVVSQGQYILHEKTSAQTCWEICFYYSKFWIRNWHLVFKSNIWKVYNWELTVIHDLEITVNLKSWSIKDWLEHESLSIMDNLYSVQIPGLTAYKSKIIAYEVKTRQ